MRCPGPNIFLNAANTKNPMSSAAIRLKGVSNAVKTIHNVARGSIPQDCREKISRQKKFQTNKTCETLLQPGFHSGARTLGHARPEL
jgi:hypothetical protein